MYFLNPKALCLEIGRQCGTYNLQIENFIACLEENLHHKMF